MAPADRVRDALGGLPGADRAREAWRHRQAGPVLQLIVGFVALLVVLRLALRHNPPPAGTIVFGALLGRRRLLG